MKERILEKLKESDEYISGEKLSEEIGVSRTAVWKHIKALKEDGYEIESVSRRGYKLVSNPDILSNLEIEPELETEFIGKEYIYLKEVDSTNEEVKRRSSELSDGAVVVSEHQTAGKGRLGRSWYSPNKKGIYISMLLRPDIPPFEAPKTTQISAAAVAESIRELGIEAQVKWPNDIVVGGRKVAGILTEMSGELMAIDYIVLGIGINIAMESDDMQEDIKLKAGSLSSSGVEIDRRALLVKILENFEKLYMDFLENGNIDSSLEICRKYSAVLGKKIRVIRKDEEFMRYAVDIDEEGALIVEDEAGKREKLNSGEISIRGESSYI